MKNPRSALALLALACAPSTLLLTGCREGGEDSAAIEDLDELDALAEQLDEQGEVEVEVGLRGPQRLDPEHITKLLQEQPEGSWELLEEGVRGPRLRLLHPDVLEALASDPAVASIRPWGRGIRSISSTSSAGWAPPSDDASAPTGSVIINSGADYSTSSSVRLTLAATDDVAVTQMCISNAATCSSWTTYATSKTWSLGSAQGSRTVRVFFRDAAGNVSEAATDTIFLDTVKPTNGSASASGSDGTLALSWTGFADAGSGVASYKVVSKTGTTAPSSCATGTVLYSGSDTSATITGLTNGTTYAIRVCATDAAGNSSTGAMTSGRPAPEYDAPTDGSVLINSDATYTNKAAVTLTLSASDPSGVGGMCISNSSTCSSWATYATSKRWGLSSGEGTKTVRVWFRDAYNNATLAAVSDTIIYDVTRPSNGTVTASPSSGQVELSWSGFADGRSGLASYKVVSKVGTVAPTSCSTGTVVYAGSDTSVTHTGLTDGTTYSYRVCAIDNAGNVSTGKTVTSRPAPEYNAPTDATVSINSGAAYSASRTVTLTIGGADDSGLGSMCISNSSSCAAWTTYATSKKWSLASGGGTKTVRVWLRDIYGNATTSAVSDTIIMDTTKPTNGTASAAMHSGTEIDLSWTGFADSQSGLASYKVVYALGSTAPTTCTRGTTGYAGTETSATISGLRANSTYSFRVCAIDAVGNTSTGATARASTNADGVSPEGSLLIDEDAHYSTDLELDLALEATDAAAVSLMCVTTSDSSDDCEAWSSYDTASTFALDAATEDGLITLYAWFEDTNGNVNSSSITDSIYLDTQPPQDGVVEVNQSADTEVVVSWSEFSDLATGVESYRAVMRSDGSTPADCSDGAVIYSGSDESVTVSDLSLGGSYAVRVCAFDYTGQSSEGATATFTPTDITAPAEHSVLVNSGAASTASTSVSLTLSASDAQGVAEMCISSSSAACDGWVEYSTSATWELGTTEGSQDVYAWFRDAAGNTTSAPASDAIIYDVTAPTDDALSASGSDATVELSWEAASDAHAGVDHYEVVYALGSTAPATCDEGTSAGSTSDLSATISGLTNGAVYSFRVCAVDGADNRSSGATTSSRPAPEYDGPTAGTVSINAGAEYAGLDPVTVEVSAEDPSGVADVCISLSSTTCTDWQSYGGSYSIELPATSGSHSVYAWFRDSYGNESSSPASDDILVDPNAPSDGEATDAPSSDASIDVAWSGYSDSESGLAGYTVVYAASDSSPASCDEGTLAYEGTGTSVTVSGLTTGQNYSFRICATDAVGNMSEGYTFTTTARDITAPANASVEINGGDAGSASTAVTLSLSATDGQGVAEMCISSTSSCSAWVPYAETYPWTISATESSQTVYAWFRDAAYNETSSPATASIIYDITNPTDGSLTGYGYDSAVELNLTAGADGGSGVSHYQIVYSEGIVAPASCAEGTDGGTTTELTTSVTGLTNGSYYSFRVCAVDGAGNMSEGLTHTDRPATEYDLPINGTVLINDGDTWAGAAAVDVVATADDASGLSTVCLSLDPSSCTDWQAEASSYSVDLPDVAGSYTVYAWFRDNNNNETVEPVSDSITVELTAPTNGTVSRTVLGDTSASLSWTGYSDSQSGIASYKVVYAVSSTAPADCNSGTTAYEGSALTTTMTGLTAGATYAVRVCAIDAAGNMSTGSTVTATTTDHVGPTGTVVINSGAAYTKTTASTLTISASDPSGVSTMCVSNTTTCTTYTAYTTSRSWTLTTGAGTKTVYVKFKDSKGNISTATTDTIVLDATAPTNGTLLGTASTGQIALSWSGFADASSGIASYKVVYSTGTTTPASCSTGTVLYAGTSTSVTHSSTVAGRTYRYRACAIDNAGNQSTGATRNVVGR